MDLAGCFIKAGKLEHMVALQQKGQLYCRPIKYFTGIEDGNYRGDKLEDVVEMRYMESGEVIVGKPGESPENGVKMPFINGQITSRVVGPMGNLFCLYMLNLLDKPLGEVFSIDEKMKGFGDAFLLIYNHHEFLRRVIAELDRLKLPYKTDGVQYLDLSTYSGKKSVFQKDLAYAFQKEFRIFIEQKSEDPIVIEIGSIEDISILCKGEDIDKLRIKGSKKDETTYTVLANIL